MVQPVPYNQEIFPLTKLLFSLLKELNALAGLLNNFQD
jgi:hypothetical protein